MSKTVTPLRDRELIDMLADDPELLAIADALVVTRAGERCGRRRRVPTPRLASVAMAAAVAAAAVAVLLVWPWGGNGGGIVPRALAAVGQGPVLHVVTEQPYGDWRNAVSLPSGKPIELTQRQEIWFDQSRDLKKTVTTVNGVVTDEMLESAQGGFTTGGPVYTCAWIAAHPVEATQARVSCNADMQNGTTPHQVPEQPPTLDLALAGFVDHYQSALNSGDATETGTGQVDGHNVIWLRIETGARAGNTFPPEEIVAIDAATYAPVLVRTVGDQGVQFKVLAIDSEAYDPALFTRPAREYLPSSGNVNGTSPIDLAQARDIVGGTALWLGQTWNGYRLVAVEKQELTTGYDPLANKEPEHSVGVVFTYAASGESADSLGVLRIKEAAQCEIAWAMPCGAVRPPAGTLLLGRPFDSSIATRDGLYIAISQGSDTSDPIAVANALQPLGK